MPTLFQCPDCRCVHDDPHEAAFVLDVRCADCGLAAEFLASLSEGEMKRAA